MGDKKKTTTQKSTKKTTYNRVLVFADGTTKGIEREDGKFYFTSDGQFRKSNPFIKEIKKVATNAKDELTEGK